MNKFLFHPVKPFSLTQSFGANIPCAEKNNLPVSKKMVISGKDNDTCPIGFEKFYPLLGLKGHNGLDLQATRWQRVYNSQEGTVIEVQTEEQRGLGVSVMTNKKYFCRETGNQEFFVMRYWHLASINVHLGDKIEVGELIGLADSTGYSTGDHLHFELKPVEILRVEGVNVKTLNVLQNNGFYGAVDAMPYMENIYALDFASLSRQVKELGARVMEFISDYLRK